MHMQYLAVASGDLVTAVAAGDVEGVPIPADLLAVITADPATDAGRQLICRRLRVVGGELVDGAEISDWWADPTGQLRAVRGDASWPLIAGASWQDRLVPDGDGWRIADASDALADARVTALGRMVAACDVAGDRLLNGIPLNEQKAFSSKEAAARAVLTEAALPHHLAILQAEADLTGESLPALASLVVARADALSAAVGTISGLRRTTADAIAAAPDQAAIDAALAQLQGGLDALLAQAAAT